MESSLKFVILASVPGSRKPLVWLNANRLELNQKIIAIGTKYSMEQTTSATLVLRSADDQVIIKIRLVNHRLQFVAQVPKKICLGSVALGGKCDGIFENYHNRTTPLEELYRILQEDSLFSAVVGYKDFSVGITGSEYALKFNGTGVITDIIPAVFTGDFVTIELVYKAIHGNGTVFTYSKETVFSIVLINGEFCLRTDGTISHTGIIFFKLISQYNFVIVGILLRLITRYDLSYMMSLKNVFYTCAHLIAYTKMTIVYEKSYTLNVCKAPHTEYKSYCIFLS